MTKIKLSKYVHDIESNISLGNNDINIEDTNINDIEIDELYYLTVDIIRFLNNKNFNFNLIKLENIIEILDEEEDIRHLINNRLYDFSYKDELTILKYCPWTTFQFWLNYLNIVVNNEYDGHTLYYHILRQNYSDDENNEDENNKYKFDVLHDNYNLRMNINDINKLKKNSFITEYLIEKYEIDYILNINDADIFIFIIIHILDNYYLKNNDKHEKIINTILDKIETPNIILLIKFCINKFDNINIFKKIIDKLNMELSVIILYLKIIKYRCPFRGDKYWKLHFIQCYYEYDKNIINYIKQLFNISNYEKFEQMVKINNYKLNAEIMEDIKNNI